MIIISGVPLDISTIINDYKENSIEKKLLNQMVKSSEKYEYDNLKQLKFELKLRKEIVNSAVKLNNSELKFSNFAKSRCNPEYWNRADNGGFILKEGVKPNEAINDIFINGNEYATECATAIMIIYYKALLSVYGKDLFNELFPRIYLMDWDIREPLLEEAGLLIPVTEFLLGDRGYFSNPDFDRGTPEWQGENVIILPHSMYYGHGIGIGTSKTMIQALNSKREEGATKSAFLLNSIGNLNLKKLSDAYYNSAKQTVSLVWKPFPAPISTI